MLDEVSNICFSKNGKILAATSWGDQGNTKNDLVVFKITQNSGSPIFSLNMPGSPYVCSLSNDGTTLIAGGKAVHARIMGSGGTLYNVYVDTAEVVNVGNINQNIPNEYKLSQNYPNPFNPSTLISYSLPKNGLVSLKVYDILGKEIATLVNENKNVGIYDVRFNADNLSGGVYFYRIMVNNFTETKKFILIK
ncbi:MAG: T9SS type A sorting domain-containing protein [Ignavibacteriae bacterium]|nr:T9SS type A sorting domain-containing protein [Ignavibacteriota bacterium]